MNTPSPQRFVGKTALVTGALSGIGRATAQGRAEEGARVAVADLNPPTRLTSLDALRGLVMFLMIFVNDLSGAGELLPDWMVHFSARHHDGRE